ncbi:vacuolar sorting protein 9 VPS9 domain containing protein [Nitzschia inconspicua]|uniref:Vacuolar sorting protein 9 VPS9 domain containing protein n=1 Tax=Nitzschia inconspicua TaxID=303405 RepID=A0A9K3L7A3_9STRA|nr:vacuolar sorting protein 9 VPS9 domain containing protein [Nitzschia inconspicua]
MKSPSEANGVGWSSWEEEEHDSAGGGGNRINLDAHFSSSPLPSSPFPTAARSIPPDESLVNSLDDSHLTAESSVASSVSSTNNSMALNPNSTMDNEDLPGIALLKEIFPEETTESLRELHHQHILAHRSQAQTQQQQQQQQQKRKHRGGQKQQHAANSSQESFRQQELQPYSTEMHDAAWKQNSMRPHSFEKVLGQACPPREILNIPSVQLPEDFLRLPSSVAVLRKRRQGDTGTSTSTQQYEFLEDLQQQMIQEYKLVGSSFSWEQERERFDFQTYAINRDDRWGLGMTLQEEESLPSVLPQSSTTIRYGLKVVGFLPDPQKIQTGEIKSAISQSPAQEAGIQLDDVLVGINGEAFLLSPISYSMSDQQLDKYYQIQKARIVSSIQQSPNPVVVHVRRQRRMSTARGDRRKSLLDSTEREMENGTTVLRQLFNSPSDIRTPQPRRIRPTPSPFNSMPEMSRCRPFTTVHPLAEALVKRKLIQSRDDQWRITVRLQHFTERTRQWEASNALRLNEKSLSLIPHFNPEDLPPDMASLMIFPTKSEEEKKSHTNTGADSCYRSDDVDNLEEVRLDHSDAFWGAKCAPSTPTLPPDSPLIPMEYLQAFYGEAQAAKIHESSSANGLQCLALSDSSSSDGLPAARRLFQNRHTWDPFKNQEFPGNRVRPLETASEQGQHIVWVPLYGIRKSLSARIVNSFVEECPDSFQNVPARMAYTMWVYDAESGREWYAPIRHWKDFCDLRAAAMALLQPSSNLYKELSAIKFPREVTIPKSSGLWNTAVFSRASPLSPLQDRRRKRLMEEFEDAREQSSRLLEEFLMELLGAIYTCVPLHPNVAEVALYVQSFLGVDAGLAEEAVIFKEIKTIKSASDLEEEMSRQLLKRSIQRYTWRIFLLHTMKAIVRDFVDAARARGPKLHDIEALEAQGRAVIKGRAMDELACIQNFLDHLVDLILDGCGHDLRLISERHEFSPIRKYFPDETYWDRLVREAVREQVEIEVYVPLRGLVSRLLVNGWRHEDMEVQFKIKELRKRPQSAFRIPEENVSPSDWHSVALILRQGVGMSTLPCVKLRAIVEAAREISRLHNREHGEDQILGADDFLPIFIYSVVRAEMERPCALCVLLRTLCDRTNRIGEIGYFLASFEAAVTHVQEIDLTEDREDMLSFLSTPFTEISLSD